MEQRLRTIAEMLVINGSLLENSGLWYGKMGVATFFFHYARYTGNELFEDFAVEIIQAIQADIHKDSVTDYDRGLAGIGAGIEYLAQNGFLAIDTNEVLADFDRRIRHDSMYWQQENNNLANGLCSLGQYLLYRLNSLSAGTNELCLLINRESMVHVVNLLENDKNLLPDDLPDILSFLCRLYILDICNPKIDRCIDKILNDFSISTITDEQLYLWTLALLRLTPMRNPMIDIAAKAIDKALQAMDTTIEQSSNSRWLDEINGLLWLLQCKKLIKPTGISMDLDSKIDSLTEKIFFQKDGELHFEKGKLSLKGCAGAGLAIMTLSGKYNDEAWLDLLG